MKSHMLPRSSISLAVKTTEFHSLSSLPGISQDALKYNLRNDEYVSRLLDRRWALSSPETKINQIKILGRKGGGLYGNFSFSNNTQPWLGEGMVNKTHHFPSFYVLRDDLLHPLVNGNKARKLDALLPLLEDNGITDVVSCGGCQSAHTAAVAVSCAERGLKSHLMLRGEEPETLTGYNLISKLYGNVVYTPRSIYARREEMLIRHAQSLVDEYGSILTLADVLEASSRRDATELLNFPETDPNSCNENIRKIAIISEGAGDTIALLGVMRLIKYLSQEHLFGKKQALKIIVDAGTGTTAVGLSLGALCLGLPWTVTAVMLADKIDGYRQKEQDLVSEFLRFSASSGLCVDHSKVHAGIVHWTERCLPRKFGNVLEGEVQECQRIARQTGILLDPIYTLAAWDLATQTSQDGENDVKVVMLHTGGTLGMFGLAQRYKSYFKMTEEDMKL